MNLTFLASSALQAIAVLFQFAAAIFALKLIRITGKWTSWILISGALCLMAIRRSLSLWELLPSNFASIDLKDDIFAAAISTLMLSGVLLISPLFLTIKQAVETLRRAKDDLEIQVAQRTEELRDANVHLSVELDERRKAEQQLGSVCRRTDAFQCGIGAVCLRRLS